MLFGRIMTNLQDEDAAAEALLATGDIVLLANVERIRQRHDESVGEYVAGAAQRFANLASSEDWLQLMTGLEKSQNPAGACVSIMVRWSISQDDATEGQGACGCHGNGPDHQECA